ncbi:MAG: hypothetical protein AAF219_11615 [Myxococcota bacterium]
MQQNSDFVDLIRAFNDHRVEYLIVGAHALAAHGHIRATKDLDVWVHTTPENATRVVRALAEFGAPLDDVTEADFSTPGIVFQIGVEPVRIDILTAPDGIDFQDAWADRVKTTFGVEPTQVLSKRALIQNKRAAGRTQDLADIEAIDSKS